MKQTFKKFYKYYNSCQNNNQKEKISKLLLFAICIFQNWHYSETCEKIFDCEISGKLTELKISKQGRDNRSKFIISKNQYFSKKDFNINLFLLTHINIFFFISEFNEFRTIFETGKNNSYGCVKPRNNFLYYVKPNEMKNIVRNNGNCFFRPILEYFDNNETLLKKILNEIIENNLIESKYNKSSFNYYILKLNSHAQKDYFNNILKNVFSLTNSNFNFKFEQNRIDLILINKQINKKYNIEIKTSVLQKFNFFRWRHFKKSDNSYYKTFNKEKVDGVDFYLLIGYNENQIFLRIFNNNDPFILNTFNNNDGEEVDVKKCFNKFINKFDAIQIQLSKDEYDLELILNYITNFINNYEKLKNQNKETE